MDVDGSLKILASTGLLEENGPGDLDEVILLLNVAELRHVLGPLASKGSTKVTSCDLLSLVNNGVESRVFNNNWQRNSERSKHALRWK